MFSNLSLFSNLNLLCSHSPSWFSISKSLYCYFSISNLSCIVLHLQSLVSLSNPVVLTLQLIPLFSIFILHLNLQSLFSISNLSLFSISQETSVLPFLEQPKMTSPERFLGFLGLGGLTMDEGDEGYLNLQSLFSISNLSLFSISKRLQFFLSLNNLR